MSETKPFPTLETERLILREMTRDDAETMFPQYTDEEVLRYLTVERAKSLKEIEEIINWGKYIHSQGTGIFWGIFRKEDGVLTGDINYAGKADETFEGKVHRADIGYALKREFWGKGFASEAIQAVIRYLFTSTELDRLELIIQPGNTRSRNLASRNGFTEEGTLRDYMYFNGTYYDYMMYSLLKREWQG